MILISAASEEQPLFFKRPGESSKSMEVRHKLFGSDSDHLSFIKAFKSIEEVYEHTIAQRGNVARALQAHCAPQYLHVGAFHAIMSASKQIEELLRGAGLIPPSDYKEDDTIHQLGGLNLNINSGDNTLVKALLFAGLNPNLAVKQDSGTRQFRTKNEPQTVIPVTSLNREKIKTIHPFGTLLTYTSLVKGADNKSLFLRDCTLITPLAATLFAKHLRLQGSRFLVDGWLPIKVKGTNGDESISAKLVLEYKKGLDRMMSYAFRSLARRKNDASQPYLADDPIVDTFAQNLVELLRLDLGNEHQPVQHGRTPDVADVTVSAESKIEVQAAG